MYDSGKLRIIKGISRKEIPSRIIFFGLLLTVLVITIICVISAVRWVNKPFAGFLLNERMVLSNVGQYQWTGTQAGLKYPDKILKANDQAISSMKDLDEVIQNSNLGDSIIYTVERAGQKIELSIQTMRFTLMDFSFIFGTYLFAGIFYLLMAVVVFILKPDTKVSWAFLLAFSFLSLYYITTFDMTSSHLGFIHVYMFASAFFPAAGVHLSFIFPEQKKFIKRYPFALYIPYIPSALLITLILFVYPDPLYAKLYGTFIPLFMVIGAISLLTSVLLSFFRKASSIARQRAKVVLFGAALAFPIPAFVMFLSNLGVTLAGMKILNNFLVFPIMIFPASIAYAIAKHNLFDVDVFIKRTVGYVIMTAVVGMAYFSIQTVVKTVVLSPILGGYAENVYPILFALLVVFLFNPVNRKVQGSVDKLFYRKKFDYKDTVLSVSNALTSVLNLDEVLRRIINTLRKEMFIDRAGVILLEPQKECKALFISDAAEGPKDDIVEQCLPFDDPLVSLVTREKKLITKYDIAEAPRYSTVREPCGQRFSEMGASLTLPLTYQDEVTGVLALGNKKSGHFYSSEDVHLLETLANQGAVAIENAKLAEQMKKEETVRTNLARYLSPQIVDEVIKNDVQVNLGGDRKVVTVLFSDIRNFTTITETRPPDQLVHILNEYFTEMAQIIFEYQGSLDKYIGDAIVAVFGSLIPLENSARNAIRASIQMMKRMPILNEKWMREYRFSMDIGIGNNTGEVFLGNIGSPERMEFTVIGDTVNVASRFSGMAKAGQILMTRETLTCCLGCEDIKYKELPPSEVKGKTGKMEVFEILYK
jgi:class 3 adenylate cyclase